jgi:hypothetical protein
MIGSYGVYCRPNTVDDDGGFASTASEVKPTYYAEQHRMIVNSGRNGTTTNMIVEPNGIKEEDMYDLCCFNDSKLEIEQDTHWYKSPVVILLFAVTIAVIVMVTGLLLYFRYFSRKYIAFMCNYERAYYHEKYFTSTKNIS